MCVHLCACVCVCVCCTSRVALIRSSVNCAYEALFSQQSGERERKKGEKKSTNARLVYARDNYEKSGKRERRNRQVIDFGIARIDLKEGKWSSPTGKKKKDMLNSKNSVSSCCHFFFFW